MPVTMWQTEAEERFEEWGAPQPGAPCSWVIQGKKEALYTFWPQGGGGNFPTPQFLPLWWLITCHLVADHLSRSDRGRLRQISIFPNFSNFNQNI